MTIDEMIAILRAAKEGKAIEFRRPGGGMWFSAEPVWCFNKYEYRVKPEPRRLWVNEYAGSLRCAHYANEDEARRSAGSADRQVEFVEVLK